MYTPRTTPYEHQDPSKVPELQTMRRSKAFALLMGMRTGKTKVILDEWGELVYKGEIRNLLVLAPAGCYRIWDGAGNGGELAKHLAPELYAQTLIATWRSGNKKALEDINRLFLSVNSEKPKILLMNIEAISTVQKAVDICHAFLKDAPTMMVIDESTTIKTYKSARTRQILAMRNLAARRRIMSGLVTPHSPMDLFSQCLFLDPGILGFDNFFAFRARYAIMKEMRVWGGIGMQRRSIKVITGFRNVEELQRKIKPYSYRKRLADCRDVLPRVYTVRDIAMTPAQKRMYDEMKDYATTKIEGTENHMTASVVVTQMLRLHRLLRGYVTDETGVVHEVEENFTKELIEILQDHDGKAIIWCSYDAEIEKVSRALRAEFGENSVARFWGGNANTREEEEKEFVNKNNNDCRFMVATASAGGRGRNWSAASLMIYYSCTYNLEHRDQSEERAESVESGYNVACVDLRCAGTVDDRILKALREKINLATAITGENYREWLI